MTRRISRKKTRNSRAKTQRKPRRETKRLKAGRRRTKSGMKRTRRVDRSRKRNRQRKNTPNRYHKHRTFKSWTGGATHYTNTTNVTPGTVSSNVRRGTSSSVGQNLHSGIQVGNLLHGRKMGEVAAQGYTENNDAAGISAIRNLNPAAVKGEKAAVKALDTGEVKLPEQAGEEIAGSIGTKLAIPYIAKGIRGLGRGIRALGRQVTGATNATQEISQAGSAPSASRVENGSSGENEEGNEEEDGNNEIKSGEIKSGEIESGDIESAIQSVTDF